MDTTNTPYSNRCDILSDLWMNYSDEPVFEEFVKYYDLGLPLAHMISEGIVQSTPRAEDEINLTFNALLKAFDMEDEGFQDLEQIILVA